MTKYILLSFVGGVVLTVAAGAAYFYFYPVVSSSAVAQSVLEHGSVVAAPDNSVITAPVSAISATSISLSKQDGTTATFTIASTTPVILSSVEPGVPGAPKTVSDIKVGALVMVQADKTNASLAAVILILPPHPAQ